MPGHLPLPAHLRIRGLKNLPTKRLANRAILFAARLLGVPAGSHLSEFRGRDGGYQDLKARLDRAELLASIAWRVVDILQARLRKVPDRHRPHYSPAARFEILEIRSLLGWNQARTAEQFLGRRTPSATGSETSRPAPAPWAHSPGPFPP